MTPLFRIAVPLALGLAGMPALAQRESDYVNYWFSDEGVPQPQVQRWAASQGLPPLVSGARFLDDLAASAQASTTASCVTVQFFVRPDGITDKFTVLDSQPKGRLDTMVLQSLKYWKFEPGSAGTWASYGLTMHAAKDVRSQSTGTRIKRARDDCVLPDVGVDSTLPMDEPVEAPRPYFPPDQVESRTQGCVTLGFSVRADGLADEYEVLDGKGPKSFLTSAMQALNDWKFPAVKPAPAGRGAVRFTYALQGADGAPPECKLPAKGGK